MMPARPCLQAQFGEFKATILGMLDTYSYEERILTTANHLMQDDVRNRVRILHRVCVCGVCGRCLLEEALDPCSLHR
jgi:hypothetical protein